MRLFYLVENNSDEDFTSQGSVLQRHRGYHNMQAFFSRELSKLNTKFEELHKTNVIISEWQRTSASYRSRPAEEFEPFTRVAGPFSTGDKCSIHSGFYIDLGCPPDLVQAAVRLQKSMNKIAKFVDQHTDNHFKLRKTAAAEFVASERNLPKTQVDIADMQEHIVHYGGTHKRGYLHNPVSFYDEPHYVGPPSHYDWPTSAAQTTYYMLSEQLKHYDLPPFSKVFSGVEDGNTHFVVCNVDHSVVWQFDGVHDRIYVAGTPKPLKPGSMFRSKKGAKPIDDGIYSAAKKMQGVTVTPSPHDTLPGSA